MDKRAKKGCISLLIESRRMESSRVLRSSSVSSERIGVVLGKFWNLRVVVWWRDGVGPPNI